MSNKLAIVTGSGLLLSAGFLGLAVMIGGDDVFHDARSFEQMKPLIDLASHKTWGWKGGDTLAMDAPINIRYEPKGPPQINGEPQVNAAPQISVTGPAELLRHVKVGDGRITADTSVTRESGKHVEAVVSGAPIRKFVVNNQQNLDLGDINQENLDLHLNGNGTVSGRGKVDHLNLTIAGPGDADLGGLEVMVDANISILGSGDATLSPHGRVKLFVAGSGDLRLLTKPAELRQTIIGNGEVHQLAGDAAKEALKAVDVSRIASEAARSAIRASLGDGKIGEIAAEAVRNGLENADIDRHVREGIARGMSHAERDMAQPPMPPVPPDVMEKDGKVVVHGSHDTDLGHIDQQSLRITVANSGSVTAEGKVDELFVTVLGSGDAKLGKLAARNVTVQIMGSGDVTVAPREELKATIMGSGDVRLRTRPARIQRQIMGSGEIEER